jgi:type IV secretion system protein VirB3
MALRKIPVRRSLHRPSLLFGAERELALLTGLVTFVCVFVAMTPVVAIAGLVLWLVVIQLLRAMAKADPIMSKVYLRHIRYQSHYNPRATPWQLDR